MAYPLKHLLAVLLFASIALAGSFGWAVEADPISPGSWTMILLPDTQNYCDTDPEALIFNSQTEWIVDHVASHNIQMVLHQGDVTNSNIVAQFDRAKVALGILETAGVPYSVAPGNHDYVLSARTSLFNDPAYFGPGSAYASQAHFNGTAGGFFETGKTDNSYLTFTAGGQDWLVFSTEFGPRNEVVDWIDDVADAHPNHNVILNTHAYLYSDGTRYDWATYGTAQSWNPHAYSLSGTINDGQELWDKVIKKHEGWKFTFNGHVLNDGTGWLASEGDNGNVVHQILANYQMRTNGGDGYLRIMEFLNDGDTVKVSSYSPYQEAYLTADDQNFELSMTSLPPVPPPPPMIRGMGSAAIDVADGTNVWTVLGSGPNPVTLITPANGADFSVAVDDIPTQCFQGVMMATVRQNIRGTSYGTVEVSHVNYFPGLGVEIAADVLQVATSQATNGGEYNVNVATAMFPFGDGWMGSHVTNTGALLEHYGVSSGDVSLVGTGLYEVSLDGIDSQDDGMLFAVGAQNGYNYISTAPLTDGSGWQVAIRDNTATAFDALESAKWSFVYVDYDAPGLVGGRVAETGTVMSGVGSFSLSHPETGVYRITIPGYTPDDGVLMLTVADMETDGATAPADNIISYEADGSTFLVNLRDRDGADSLLEDASFVFAFLAFDSELMPAVPGDANYDGVVDQNDATALASHWGEENALWADGDFDLDGVVGPKDASIMAAHWGHGAPGAGAAVPEPSTLMLLLGLAAAITFRPARITRRR
ncbi:MAG: PEP-CTERM sorting domain-containing protein [Pirellulales bacterium]|nr:PEP-CTERM sorting domain-containing protein [Pirellulales bacterium]